MFDNKRKVKFILEDDNNYVDSLQKIEIVIGGSASLDEMVENFKSFLLALGYGPEEVSEYLDPDYEPKEECCGMCCKDNEEVFKNTTNDEFNCNYHDDLQELVDDMDTIEPIKTPLEENKDEQH